MKTTFQQTTQNEWTGDLKSVRGEIAWNIHRTKEGFELWLFSSLFFAVKNSLEEVQELANNSFAQIQHPLNF